MRLTKEIKEGLQAIVAFLDSHKAAGQESELFNGATDQKIDAIFKAIEWISDKAYSK